MSGPGSLLPGRIYAATLGHGLWVTENSGEDWERIGDRKFANTALPQSQSVKTRKMKDMVSFMLELNQAISTVQGTAEKLGTELGFGKAPFIRFMELPAKTGNTSCPFYRV